MGDGVWGYCPMGCGRTLFLAEGGHVACFYGMCPNPSAVDEILADRETDHVVELGEYGYNLLHPLRERLPAYAGAQAELLRCELGALIGAMAPADVPTRGRYRIRAFDDPWERLS